MIKSIKAYLEDLANTEKLKEEEEKKRKELERKKEEEKKRQKEQEEKRRQEEQQRLVSEIRLSCTTLNNEEAKLELSREKLLLKTEKVLDNEQRKALLDLINNGGIIHKKYQEQQSKLTKEMDSLKSTGIESLKLELKSKEEKILQLQSDLDASKLHEKEQEKTSDRLIGQIGDLKKQVKDLQKENEDGTVKNRKRTSISVHIVYWLILFSVLILSFSWLTKINEECQYWKYEYNTTWDELCEKKEEFLNSLRESDKTKDTLNFLAEHIPFIITDIEIKNAGEKWGDKIYSSKSTYFKPRIKYIGINSGTYELYFKIFDNVGKLRYNEETSPKGYSFSDELNIVKGENISDEITGWGNDTPGYWPAGSYRIEIWYKEKELFEKTYRVY